MSRAVEKDDERVVKLLLENGARPDFKDEFGRTPLSRAKTYGRAAIVELLDSYCTPEALFAA